MPLRALMALSLALLVLSIGGSAVSAADQNLRTQAQALFKPLPKEIANPDNPITREKVELGRMLFFETRVSADGTVSCSRCHQPFLYGTDALAKPIGAEHRVNPRNAPTVLNTALQISSHWRGDRKDVEDQATKALTGPPSFGNPSFESAMAKLKAIAGYAPLFAKAFPGQPDPITPENWGKAIGAYERTLVTPSPFDRYLAGEDGALSPEAQAGLRDFMQVGCAGCHAGAGVGGTMYGKFGVVEEYWKATGSKEIDKGRFDVTKDPGDTYVFKVPSLRNVAMTPPYFHDGSVATLPEAVRVMARVQLGRTLSDEEVHRVVAFLASLTGTLPAEFVTAPVLPASAFAGGPSGPEVGRGAPQSPTAAPPGASQTPK
jgi:cytochrome c peroxidase